jgi:hypothetical protein
MNAKLLPLGGTSLVNLQFSCVVVQFQRSAHLVSECTRTRFLQGKSTMHRSFLKRDVQVDVTLEKPTPAVLTQGQSTTRLNHGGFVKQIMRGDHRPRQRC